MPEHREALTGFRLGQRGRKYALGVDRLVADGFRWLFDHGTDSVRSCRMMFVGFGEQAFLDCPILFRPATVVLFHVASHGTVRRALRTLALEPLGLLRSLPAATSGIADPVHSAPSSPDGAGLIRLSEPVDFHQAGSRRVRERFETLS